MFSQNLEDAMNEQINKELYSAYLYLSMAAYCDAMNLPGFAHWMRLQSIEEQEHAMKFYSFINERGGRVVLKAIDEPPAEFNSPLHVFEETLTHEQKVTKLINGLYKLAIAENDYASQIFLQWFITEQVEEEDSATEILEMLNRVGDSGQALLLMDRQLAQRSAEH